LEKILFPRWQRLARCFA